jgi:hypothetical protein
MNMKRSSFKNVLGILVFLLILTNVSLRAYAQKIQNLPNGNHVYREVKTSSIIDSSRYFIFRKVGNFVIGKHFQAGTDWDYCFKGQLQGSSLINVVNAVPRMGQGLSGFKFEKGKSENLRNYQKLSLKKVVSAYPTINQSFRECLNLFR